MLALVGWSSRGRCLERELWCEVWVKLDRDDVEAIARRVAELLGSQQRPAVRYVDAAEVARALAVERDCVYAHADELGAIRLGGPTGRLRFDLHDLPRLLAERSASARTFARRPASATTGDSRRAELTSSRRQRRTRAPGR
jgi:hypothetical protein